MGKPSLQLQIFFNGLLFLVLFHLYFSVIKLIKRKEIGFNGQTGNGYTLFLTVLPAGRTRAQDMNKGRFLSTLLPF